MTTVTSNCWHSVSFLLASDVAMTSFYYYRLGEAFDDAELRLYRSKICIIFLADLNIHLGD